MRTIRVLDLRDTFEIGGPGKTILETYREMDASRFELHLGVFLRRQEHEETPFVAAARRIGLPVHMIRGHNQYDPRMIWRVASLVERLGIHILHAHEVKSDVVAFLASRLHRVPIMTTLHGWFGSRLKHHLLIGLDRRLARRFDCVVAVSGEIRREMAARGVPAGKLHLLHNAIVLERYQRTGQRGFLSTLLGRDLPRPLITSIGRLSPEKGHVDLVDAVALLAERGHRVSVVLAGDGPARSILEDRIRALRLEDRVHLPGYLDAPQRVLEDTDLTVLPSHTEGLPNAVLESLAMGVPVLATAVGGTSEIISDGDTGRLVAARCPEALANGIQEFLTDPSRWRGMAERGRWRVQAEFDFAARTRKLEAIYTQVAALGLE